MRLKQVTKGKLSVASLFEVGVQFRQSHGLEFAKGMIRQLGGDDVAVQIFDDISTYRARPRRSSKS